MYFKNVAFVSTICNVHVMTPIFHLSKPYRERCFMFFTDCVPSLRLVNNAMPQDYMSYSPFWIVIRAFLEFFRALHPRNKSSIHLYPHPKLFL
jgi:hypothetical protein